MSPLSLTESLADLPDPRSRHGQRFPLLPILSLVTLGLLLGRKSLDAIARLGPDYGPQLLLALGFPRGHNPVKSTLSRLLRRLDPQAIEQRSAPGRLACPPTLTWSPWTARRRGAADEATFLASTSFPPTPPGSKPSWVNSAWTPRPTSTRPPCNCWASSLGRTRSSPATPPSANATWRRKSSRPAATTCSPSRRTSRAWRWTSQRGLPSRPRRNRSPRLFPPALPTSLPGKTATTVDKGHGRLERRTLRVTSILTLHQKWPGLKQGFEVTRERTEKGKTTVEVVYGITSLGAEEADADRLLGLVREHWRIENCLHWVRDRTLGEDACRVRSGGGRRCWRRCGTWWCICCRGRRRPARRAKVARRSVTGWRRVRAKPSKFSAFRHLNNATALPRAPLSILEASSACRPVLKPRAYRPKPRKRG